MYIIELVDQKFEYNTANYFFHSTVHIISIFPHPSSIPFILYFRHLVLISSLLFFFFLSSILFYDRSYFCPFSFLFSLFSPIPPPDMHFEVSLPSHVLNFFNRQLSSQNLFCSGLLTFCLLPFPSFSFLFFSFPSFSYSLLFCSLLFFSLAYNSLLFLSLLIPYFLPFSSSLFSFDIFFPSLLLSSHTIFSSLLFFSLLILYNLPGFVCSWSLR